MNNMTLLVTDDSSHWVICDWSDLATWLSTDVVDVQRFPEPAVHLSTCFGVQQRHCWWWIIVICNDSSNNIVGFVIWKLQSFHKGTWTDLTYITLSNYFALKALHGDPKGYLEDDESGHNRQMNWLDLTTCHYNWSECKLDNCLTWTPQDWRGSCENLVGFISGAS